MAATNLANLPLRTDANGYLLVTIGGGNWTPDKLTLDSTNLDIVLWRQAAKTLQIDADGAGAALTLVTVKAPLSLNGKVLTYNAVATVGWGVPSIYATGFQAAATTAIAALATYTVGAADGVFEYGVTITLTTAGSANFTTTVAFTDESNVGRVNTVDWCLAGAFPSSVTSAGQYAGTVRQIRCKSGTSITVATTGTFTGATYNASAQLKQVA